MIKLKQYSTYKLDFEITEENGKYYAEAKGESICVQPFNFKKNGDLKEKGLDYIREALRKRLEFSKKIIAEYNLEIIKETEKAVLVYFCGQGERHNRGKFWTPKSMAKIENGFAAVPQWFIDKKAKDVNFAF